ncbi:MAG: hypothetical protein HQ592_00010 [Planctomycetes bacterium]|nr:hypothetical protein [Planctomycetota bacterium]
MIEQLFRTIVFWILGLDNPGTIVETKQLEWYTALQFGDALLICLGVLGLAAAAVNFLPRNGLPWRARIAVALIRIVGFGILIFLLCQFELRLTVERSLPPNVAVLTDTSGSMGFRDQKDGPTRLEIARKLQAGPLAKLADKANVAPYTVGWQLEPDDGRAQASGNTHLMDCLKDLARQERDLQAVVLLSDANDTTGNIGAGVSAVLVSRGLPLYPVVIGSPDATAADFVKRTGGGDYVRLGDELHLQAEFVPSGSERREVTALLFVDGTKVPIKRRDNIRVEKEPVPIGFVVKPKKAGRFTYRIRVEGAESSGPSELLEAKFTVDVIDQRIRVLMVDIPRPELAQVSTFLEQDPVIDLAVLVKLPKGGWHAWGEMHHKNVSQGLPDDEQELYEYDVIIWGDISRGYFQSHDAASSKMHWLVEFVKRRGGGLITLGGQSVYSAGLYNDTELASILPFGVVPMRKPQAPKKFSVIPTPIGLSHPVMMLERDAEGNKNAWLELPELEGCNRVGEVKPGALLLAIRDLDGEELPVIAYQIVGKGRVLSLTADTTWRWGMQRPRGDTDTGEAEGEDYFRRFWGNAVRDIAPDPRLTPDRPQIDRRVSDAAVGQRITLTTRLINKLYQPVEKADLTVRVTSPSDRVVRIYPCDSRTRKGVYEYDVTLTEPGTWRVEVVHEEEKVMQAIKKAEQALAKAKREDDRDAIKSATFALETAKAVIAVEKVEAGESRSEMQDPRSKPDFIAGLADDTGGRTFRPDEVHELLTTLDLASHKVTRSYTVPVWNLPAIMIVFILLVALDCLIRKRRGLV